MLQLFSTAWETPSLYSWSSSCLSSPCSLFYLRLWFHTSSCSSTFPLLKTFAISPASERATGDIQIPQSQSTDAIIGRASNSRNDGVASDDGLRLWNLASRSAIHADRLQPETLERLRLRSLRQCDRRRDSMPAPVMRSSC